MTALQQQRPPVQRWRALGTYVYLATADVSALEDARRVADQVLDAVDRTCSRFRADSDLSRANARPGRYVDVPPLLVAAVEVALEAARVTDGLVDPCLGRSLVWLGYDADLDLVRSRHDDGGHPWSAQRASTSPPIRPGAWREVALDSQGRIRVPEGCALDLGATAKAWASDLVAATVVDHVDCPVVVSLGGDVRIEAPPGQDAPSWPIAVTERPDDPHAELVWLSTGGIATSSTTARRWTRGGVQRHHLVDPRNGLPVAGPWRTVTATGGTCVAANTATTAALVLGEQAVPWLAARSTTARLVADDGSVSTVGAWPVCGGESAGGTADRTRGGRS